MDNISFEIPIYMGTMTMFEIATNNSDKRVDVVDEVVFQINQGDPVWEDDICEEIEELFGEEASEHLDDIDLKEYISYTGKCEIDYDEMFEARNPDLLVFRVSCEFDVDKFAEKYGLEPIDEEQEK